MRKHIADLLRRRIVASIGEDEMEHIYELTYKYQMLKQEGKIGDRGLPQPLPDRAYMEIEKIKDELNDVLNVAAEDIIDTYEVWLDRHTPDVSDFYDQAYDSVGQYIGYDLKYERDYIYRLVDMFGEDVVREHLVEYIQDNYGVGEETAPDEHSYDPAAEDYADQYGEKMKYLDKKAPTAQMQRQMPFMPEEEVPAVQLQNLKSLDNYSVEQLADMLNAVKQTKEERQAFIEMFERDDVREEYIKDEAEILKDSWESDPDGAFPEVEEIKNEFENEWDDSIEALDDKITLFQKSLTTMHNNGDMAEYIMDDREAVEILQRLSDGEHVDKWNKDLSRLLGYEVGAHTLPPDDWFAPQSRLIRAARLLCRRV